MGKYLGVPLFNSHISIMGRLQKFLEIRQTTSNRKVVITNKGDNDKIEAVINKIDECIEILKTIK